MKKCLVTGGAGFIGSHLCDALIHQGYEVVVLDNFCNGKKENIEHLLKLPCFSLIEGDVRDPKAVERAMSGVEGVFHQAALGSVPGSIVDPHTNHEVNATGTLNVLWAAKNAGVKRFVNAASCAAYGDDPELPKKENMIPAPLSPYATTKLIQESYCKAFYESYGLQTISLRYFNVYGPRQDPNSQYAAVIPKFFTTFFSKQSPRIFGDGEQTRDFVFVSDVVDANLKAAQSEMAKGQVYNVCSGQQVTINALSKKIADLVGMKNTAKHEATMIGDIRHSLGDGQLILQNLGWTPKTSLDQGLQKTAQWFGKKYA